MAIHPPILTPPPHTHTQRGPRAGPMTSIWPNNIEHVPGYGDWFQEAPGPNSRTCWNNAGMELLMDICVQKKGLRANLRRKPQRKGEQKKLRGREEERKRKAVTLSSSWIQPSLKLEATYMSQYIPFYACE